MTNDQKDQKEGQLFTIEQARVCRDLKNNIANPHAKELSQKFKAGQVDYDTLKEANKVLQDPNRMKDNSYQYWIKALAKGRFPRKGKLALNFLRSLGGTPREQKYARELMRTLADDAAGPLSERIEKDHLKTLHILREEDLKEEALEKTSSTTRAIVTTAETRRKIEKVTEVRSDSWELEPADAKLTKKIDAIDLQRAALFKKSGSKQRELEIEEEKETKNEAKIAKLKKDLEVIDEKIDELNNQMLPLREKENEYLERNMNRYRILNYFSGASGINIRKIVDLITWDSVPAGRRTVAGLTLDIPKDGTTRSSIKVKKVYFERKKGSDPTDPGELKIDYEDEEGTPCHSLDRNYRKFIAFLKASHAYEPLKNLDEFYDRAQDECGYKLPEAGQVYSTQIPEDFTDEELVSATEQNYLKYKSQSFRIERVKEMDGVTYIVLDQKVGDLDTKIFNLGQFASLLKRYNFKREFTSQEDLQEALNAQAKATKNQCADFVKNSTDKEKALYSTLGGVPDEEEITVKLPKDGEVKNVLFCDPSTRRQYKAKLKTQKNSSGGEEEYLLEYNLPEEKSDSNVVPIRKTPKKVIQKRLNRRAFQELANKNAIQEQVLSQTPPGGLMSPSPEEEQDKKSEEKPELSQEDADKKKIYKEALEYQKINKFGDFAKQEQGFLKSLWINSRFLSTGDLWELCKAGYEYYVRRFERRQKERFSSVAKEVPFFAPEMQRINQQAETDQVNQFKEAYDQFGVDQIVDRVRTTKVRDEMKAAFIVLSEKGQMRWDDIEMWKNLNRFITDPKLKIPIPRNGDPYTKQSEDDERTGMDFLKGGIDSLWGQGQYNDWYRQGKSTYIQNARGYFERGKELENLQGGHERRLGALLKLHKQGVWVDPQEFEGLILHSIEAGKSSMQAKLYFMVEGAAAKNPNGETILSFDRIAHINSEMLPRFPILEYMTARAQRFDAKTGKVKEHRFTKDDFETWVQMFDEGHPEDPEKNKPGEAVNRFLWEYVIPSDDTQNRINKAIRNGENIDHDDMFAYLPPATEGIITDACKSTTGSKKFFTVEGYANAFPGFSQYMRSLAEHDRKTKLMEAVKSYVRFEGIITDKYEKAVDKSHDSYQRFDDATLRSSTIVSNEPPIYFIEAINAVMKKMIVLYDDDELTEIGDKIYNLSQTIGNISHPQEREKQNEVNYAYQRFGKVFNRVVKSDNGQKMLDAITAANLPDMPYRSTAARARKPSDYANDMAIE